MDTICSRDPPYLETLGRKFEALAVRIRIIWAGCLVVVWLAKCAMKREFFKLGCWI
jgi:hypothetical protein